MQNQRCCITDDNIFINETKTVQQTDGSNFTCIKRKRGFTFFKHTPSTKDIGCKIGKTKVVSNQFLLECRNQSRTQNAYHLVACYPKRDNKNIRVEAKQTYDDIVDENNGLGFRYRCYAKDNSYHYGLVGCLVEKEFVLPDEIFVNETSAILCLQERSDKLRLKFLTHDRLVEKVCTNALGDSEAFTTLLPKIAKNEILSTFNKVVDKTELKKCSESWTFNDHTGFCYKVFDNANWNEAKKRCEAENSTLASVHSLEESQFIANLSFSLEAETWFWKMQAWIGLYNTDKNAEWKWVDNTSFDYGKWGIHEPDDLERQHCGYIRITASSTVMVADVGDFQNIFCDEVLSKFVCKKASL
uniref:C-type lectin domain-containing protein n=1 Tax=Panagrolaimus sp. PS1159 TaxID=55785 RepID=A0AC35EVF6_9BILA